MRRGQVLVRVPRCLLLTAETAMRSPAIGPLVAAAGLSEWQAMVLQLLAERAAGADSFWAPYMDTLPDDMVRACIYAERWTTRVAGMGKHLQYGGGRRMTCVADC